MTTRIPTRAALAVLLMLVLDAFAVPARGSAQPAIDAASEDQQALARAAYAEGVQAFERGDYAVALERFETADAAVSSPNVKLMRARCLAQLRKDVQAYAMYRATIDEANAAADPRYQASAAAAAEEKMALEAKLALLTVAADDRTGNAVLAINGEAVPRAHWHEEVPIAPGTVTITLTAPQGQQDRAQPTLAAGTRSTIQLAVAARAQAPEATPASVVHPADTSAAVTSEDGLPVLPIALGAAGVVGIAAFAVLGAMSNAELDELDSKCPSHRGCDPELADVASRGSSYQTAANVSLGAGVVLLAAGATLFVLDLSSEDEGLEVALTAHGAQLRGAL